MSKVHNLIIIGSGPAGFTAAIYAARANLNPFMFEGQIAGGTPGGQLMLTTEVENYPGFPKGIQGPELMQLFREQAARFGTEMLQLDVTSVDFKQKPFKLVADGKDYFANSVIISTGASARWLGLESEKKLQGFGVSACATCDGAFFRNKDVLVVGGGDTAMEEANFLTRFATKVTIVHRRDTFRASKIMVDRSKKNPKIDWLLNSEIIEFKDPAAKKLTSVILKDTVNGKTSERKTDGVFMALGHVPNTQIFKGQIDLNEVGYIQTKPGTTLTNIPGVFAAGDVQDHVYRQAITAAGSGCMAALDAERYLAHHHE